MHCRTADGGDDEGAHLADAHAIQSGANRGALHHIARHALGQAQLRRAAPENVNLAVQPQRGRQRMHARQ